ncbi:hypothetical protein [Catenulispora subtropica]|uniref:Serine/threonine protein kinase n=1 Tax=Catenulispora subtropica TaxID=450798 RepID=A0ABN2QJG3_9ACTN
MEDGEGTVSVQRGDLVAGRYRLGDPLGPAWRAHDEHDDVEVILVPTQDDTPDATPWRDRRAVLPTTATATGDHGAWLISAPVAARTLSEAVAQWGALPAEQVLTIAAGAVTALSTVGPHPSMTPDHILLTDDGNVLLLPVPTPDNALFDLGAALFLAAEGRSPFDPPTGDPRQPTLAGLIRGLMQKDPDHAAALDRTYAELSRLGAPLEAEHGTDTLMEAQSASAEAAEDGTGGEEITDAGDEPTHVTQSFDLPTQPMTAAELLAETGEGEVMAEVVAEEVAGDETEAGGDEASGDIPAQPMSTADLLAETDDELTRPVPTIEAEPEAETATADDEPPADLPTQPMSAADLLAETDDELTRPVPIIEAEAEAEPETEATTADDEPEAELLGEIDEEPTRPVPTIIRPGASKAEDHRATQVVAMSDALSDAIPDHEITRPVPVIEPDPPVIEAPTEPLAADHLAADHLADTNESNTSDHEITRPVPAAGPGREEITRPVPTIAPGSPDALSTQALPLAAAMPPEPPPTKPEQIPVATAAVAPPTMAADVVPPTQAADAVPPQQPQNQFQQQPQPPNQFLQQPQGQFQPQPQFGSQPQQSASQPPQSSAPPTQAAAAFSAPPPGAANPWLQPPQQPQSPQLPPNPWQNPQPGGMPPGPGGPGSPSGPWGNQPGQPFYPMPAPPPKNNTGKTVGIIVGAVAAVALVVIVVVLATKGGKSSKDGVDNAGNTSSHSASSQPSSVPGTNFPSGSTSSSSSSPSPSDSSSDTDTPSDSSSSSDSYTPPPDLTSTPFDPSVLNEGATDKTPLTLEALAPQDFRDDKGVHYSLKAGSVQPCVQSDMSANMKDILTSNSCKSEIAASYVDDSGQYLVSVKVLPLPDQHTATVVYDDLAQQSAADFGIWCPQDGPGSSACQGDYRSATIKQYREQQHRYVILSVALAVNHSESSSIAPWLDAAAKKAVDAAGPDNWSGNQ